MHLRRRAILTISCLAALAFMPQLFASHAPGHPDPDPYNCTVLVEKPNGRMEEEQLGKMDCILHKLDRIERRMGCPLEDYLDGECPYSPVDTTATFCISQGREGGVDAAFGAESGVEYDVGAGWPNAVWAKAVGKIHHPAIIPPFIPVPTELNITGGASLGRNFDICIEVPLEPATDLGPLELYSDADLIDQIVRTINEPQTGAKSKFQRRLGRLANYAIFRVPGTNRLQLVSVAGGPSELALAMEDDGESEFDLVEDAMERLMNGEFGASGDGGPLEILKSPAVQDLSSVLELPAPAKMILADPDIILGRIFEIGGMSGALSGDASVAALTNLQVCDRLGLTPELRTRFPGVASFCGLFPGLPSFQKTTGIFAVVDFIRSLVVGLPTLDDIRQASCEIAGWACPEDSA